MRKKIDLTQGTPEWLEWRRNLVTASDVGAIMGINPYKTPSDVLAEKRGRETKQTDAMKWGSAMEAEARTLFEELTCRKFSPAIYQLDQFGASLDGISDDGTEIVEIKCPSSPLRISGVPPYHYAQMQMQLYVSGASKANYFVFYSQDSFDHQVFHQNQTFIENMVKVCSDFLCSPSDGVMTEEMEALAERLLEIQVQRKALEQEEAAIKAKFGVHPLMGQKFAWTRSEVKGGVDYSVIPQLQGVDLEAYRKGSTFRFALKRL